MTDRIDAMTHEELKTLTRKLVCEVSAPWNDMTSQSVIDALKPFRPIPLERLRDYLESEGWVSGESAFKHEHVYLSGVGYYSHPDWK